MDSGALGRPVARRGYSYGTHGMTQKARQSCTGSGVTRQVPGAGIAAPGWHVCRSHPQRRLGAWCSGLAFRLRPSFGVCLAGPAPRTKLEGSSWGLAGAKPESISGVWWVCVCAHVRMCQIVRTTDCHLDTFQTPYVLVAQSCLTLGDPMDCNPPGSSVHGILQARILEWVAMPFARESFRPRDQTRSRASQAGSLPPCHLGSPF